MLQPKENIYSVTSTNATPVCVWSFIHCVSKKSSPFCFSQ